MEQNFDAIKNALERIADALERHVELHSGNVAITAEPAKRKSKKAAAESNPISEVVPRSDIEDVTPISEVAAPVAEPVSATSSTDPRAKFASVSADTLAAEEPKQEVEEIKPLTGTTLRSEPMLTWGDVEKRMMALINRDRPSAQQVCDQLQVPRVGLLFDQPHRYAEIMRLIYAAEARLDGKPAPVTPPVENLL